MVRRHHVLSALAVAFAAIPLACIEDLPPAKTCPPAEARAMGDCLAAITAAQPACSADATHECLQGTRSSCICGANECPSETPACFDDECPALVRAVAPDARCLRPAVSDFITNAPPGCLCGCVGCARICDGKGPSIGFKLPENVGDPPGPLIITLKSLLPAKGKLGAYVRIRGIASLAFVAGRGNEQLFGEQLRLANEATFIEKTFELPAGWTDLGTAPDKIALVGQTGPTLAEVDCIIPYVRP